MEVKDLFEYLGLSSEEINDVDAFKSAFNKQFVRLESAQDNPELVKRITGQALGSIETKVKQVLKDSGVEFESGDLKDKRLEDIVALGVEKMTKQQADLMQRLKDLKESKDTIPKSEYSKLEKELTKATKDLQQLNQMNSGLSEKLTQAERKALEEAKKLKMKYALTSVMSKVPLSDSATEAEKIGFETIVKRKFNFDFNESDELIIRDKEGNLIENPSVAGKFLSPEEVLKKEATELKIIKTKQAGGASGAGGARFKPNENTAPANGGRRPLHPSRR